MNCLINPIILIESNEKNPNRQNFTLTKIINLNNVVKSSQFSINLLILIQNAYSPLIKTKNYFTMKSSHQKSHYLNTSKKSSSKKTLLTKILSSLYHPRYQSSKHSPYQDKCSIERLKNYLKSSSRCLSPKIQTPSSSFKRPSNLKPKTFKKNFSDQKKHKIQDLVELNTTNNLTFAPKLYDNQLFHDVYDNKNNHDRILITPSESISTLKDEDSFSEPKFIIAANLEESQTQSSDIFPKPPENSYNSNQAPVPFHQNLLEKLEKLTNSP